MIIINMTEEVPNLETQHLSKEGEEVEQYQLIYDTIREKFPDRADVHFKA